jgi:hypothetical protein
MSDTTGIRPRTRQVSDARTRLILGVIVFHITKLVSKTKAMPIDTRGGPTKT